MISKFLIQDILAMVYCTQSLKLFKDTLYREGSECCTRHSRLSPIRMQNVLVSARRLRQKVSRS